MKSVIVHEAYCKVQVLPSVVALHLMVTVKKMDALTLLVGTDHKGGLTGRGERFPV
jgi:hypothetical protein